MSYVLLACAAVVVVAIAYDKLRPRRPSVGRDRPKQFRSGLYNPAATIDGLRVAPALRIERDRLGEVTILADLSNAGRQPLGPLHTELSLIYTNHSGRPALGGNHLDGVLLDPSPNAPLLEAGETTTIVIYQSETPAVVADQDFAPHNQAVADQVAEFNSVLDFLERDETGAFRLQLRVGSPNHAASLGPDDLRRA
ncbi:hypothetical protein KO486_15970 [Octadecabacter sp. B2R22]|nr:hypothetical protein [Octadecabacter sp. B2R22]